jgi:hypothetical protein
MASLIKLGVDKNKVDKIAEIIDKEASNIDDVVEITNNTISVGDIDAFISSRIQSYSDSTLINNYKRIKFTTQNKYEAFTKVINKEGGYFDLGLILSKKNTSNYEITECFYKCTFRFKDDRLEWFDPMNSVLLGTLVGFSSLFLGPLVLLLPSFFSSQRQDSTLRNAGDDAIRAYFIRRLARIIENKTNAVLRIEY